MKLCDIHVSKLIGTVIRCRLDETLGIITDVFDNPKMQSKGLTIKWLTSDSIMYAGISNLSLSYADTVCEVVND